jgi:hypothetical protein
MREVTEDDLRMPEFRGVNLDQLEFREDGAIVRKDRWETAVRRVANLVAEYDREFDVQNTTSQASHGGAHGCTFAVRDLARGACCTCCGR